MRFQVLIARSAAAGIRLLAAALAALLGVGPVHADQQLTDLQAALDSQRAELSLPGCVLLVSGPDGRAVTAVSGFADLEAPAPVQAGTLFRAGSITKTFMAVLALKLAEKGVLSLDDPALKHVGNDNRWLSLSQAREQVTIRHLLQHKSGIPDPLPELKGAVPAVIDMLNFDGQIGGRILPRTGWADPFLPGERCRYCNVGYWLLGDVIENAAGRDLDQLLDEYIFAPLALESTYYTAYEQTPPQAQGYCLVAGKHHNVTFADRAEVAGAAGAIAADAADLAVFGRALFEGELLSEQQWAEMTAWEPSEDGDEHGLGLLRRELDGRETVGHMGQTVGYRAELAYVPASRVLVVVLANQGVADLEGVVDKALDALEL